MYLVLSAFTSSPVSLVATTKLLHFNGKIKEKFISLGSVLYGLNMFENEKEGKELKGIKKNVIQKKFVLKILDCEF
jgi:hypothetical protein